MINKCFLFIRQVVMFFKIKGLHNTRKIHSFSKGSIALLIELLGENKYLHLKFEEIREVASVQAWLLLKRNRRSVSFWKSGSKKKNRHLSSEKLTHRTPCIVCFVYFVISPFELRVKERLIWREISLLKNT